MKILKAGSAVSNLVNVMSSITKGEPISNEVIYRIIGLDDQEHSAKVQRALQILSGMGIEFRPEGTYGYRRLS